jgi:hypothetical protein
MDRCKYYVCNSNYNEKQETGRWSRYKKRITADKEAATHRIFPYHIDLSWNEPPLKVQLV